MASLSNLEEFESLRTKEKGLNEAEEERILSETKKLVEHQNVLQDINVLPTLSIEDIPDKVEYVPFENKNLAHQIPFMFFEQPTNSISFTRVKANIKEIPGDLKEYVPLYNLILPKLGTKNFKKEEFQNLLRTASPGIEISLDCYTDIEKNDVTYENLVYEFSFLDRNCEKALSLYEEMFSVPNFFDYENLNNIIKQESVRVANEIVNNSLDYAISYASAGFKDYKATYEDFKCDMFIAKLGAELMQIANPKELLHTIAEKLYLLHNIILRRDAISCSLHGSKKIYEAVHTKLSMVINGLKNENPVFLREIEKENEKVASNSTELVTFNEKHMKSIIKTSAQVNDCVEVFKIPNYSHEDYAKCVIMSNLLALTILHTEIREKGGAYGSGASPSDSGLCVFYSYRDPKPSRTYKVFEKAVLMIREGRFTDENIREAKIFTFSKVDKIINPANKGLSVFLRSLSEEERNLFRNRLINVTRDDLIEMSVKYFIPQLENGTTSRVVFGGINKEDGFDDNEWEYINTLDFLSDGYFTTQEENVAEMLNEVKH